MLLSPSLRIVDPCRIGLVTVMRSSLVCSTGGCLWLFTAVFVQFLQCSIVVVHARLEYITLTSPIRQGSTIHKEGDNNT